MSIVLVEPDAILAQSYAAALEEKGYHVVSVRSAQSAIEAADLDRPRAAIINLEIARHNGVELLYEFKSYAEWQSVPVILLVSQLNHDLADSDLLKSELGVRAVLVKTRMTLDDLCDELVRVVGTAL
ncbi:response regulator [Candidatus Saccharibacteria bacterium]|nr:response regulator [Candidatus Saccharibacteria bacterium]